MCGQANQNGVSAGTFRLRAPNRAWLVFLLAMVGSFLLHELGHCAAAWIHGYGAIPTPLKEYLHGPVLRSDQELIALGGIIGSIAAVLVAIVWFHCEPKAPGSALLAGTLVGPGFYSLRFALAGRGHDGTEFQEAQAALGLLYSGHALDWFFVALLAVTAVFWFWRTETRLTFRVAGRLFVGAMVGIIALAFLQKANNAIFDPLLEEKPRVPASPSLG